jgi:hypothetical protein
MRKSIVHKNEASSPKRDAVTTGTPLCTAPGEQLVNLQRCMGNHAMRFLLESSTVQTKFMIGRPKDIYEQEADRLSDEVMKLPDPIENTRQAVVGNAGRAAPEPVIDNLKGGRPLSQSERAFFEPRFGMGFGDIRVHTGLNAAEAARSIRAKAFTTGSHIVFGHGRYRPGSWDGRRLLAHELIHTLQQRASGIAMIQGDFESDFAGRKDIPADPKTMKPSRTVLVETYATQTEPGRWVYAPYSIYFPHEIPEKYQDRIMESSKASDWRLRLTSKTDADFEREVERLQNRSELTVRDMRKLAEGPGKKMDIRIMMAKVGNDYRFVGYDMSLKAGQLITSGFVESEAQSTRGVGRALFADRIVRALANGAENMHLEVYHSRRTEDFHARIFTIIGRNTRPSEGLKYSLTRREMIRIALEWSEALTYVQWTSLHALANANQEPTEAQVQAAFWRGTVVRAGGTERVPSQKIIHGEIHKPTSGSGSSGRSPTGGGPRGTEPQLPGEIPAAVSRLQRLMNARTTLQLWRPVMDARGKDQKRIMDAELTSLDKSITELGDRLDAAYSAASRQRPKRETESAKTARESTFQASLKSLATITASETSIGDRGFRALEELSRRSIEQVPIQVALGEAFRTGRYSDQAFRFMLSQIDPAAQESILYGPRGGLRSREAQFRRLTAYYGFRSNTMPSGEVSLSGLSGGRLAVTRGTAAALLLVEAANLTSQAYQAYKIGQENLKSRNLYPFIRRLMFWNRLGAHPAVVGVDDDLVQWSPDYERNYDKAIQGLKDWDAFYIEDTPSRPCLSDMDVLHIGVNLAHYVRNFAEFATLFFSSGQDAVKWETPQGGKTVFLGTSKDGWSKAKWYVRVGEYDTGWQNSVEERWVYHGKLTQLMNVMVARIIANTEDLLRLQAQGKMLPGEESRFGSFLANTPPANAKPAKLRDNETKTTVYTVRIRGDQSYVPGGGGTRIKREVTWSTPPVFHVHQYKRMGFATVSGADFNTYAALRRTSYETYTLHQSASGANKEVTSLAENEEAFVEIPWLLLDIQE